MIKFFWLDLTFRSCKCLFNLLFNFKVVFFDLLIKNWSKIIYFNQKLVETNLFQSKIDQKFIKFVIADTITTWDLESDGFRCPNLLESESEFESLLIRFRTPNCLSFQAWLTAYQKNLLLKKYWYTRAHICRCNVEHSFVGYQWKYRRNFHISNLPTHWFITAIN